MNSQILLVIAMMVIIIIIVSTTTTTSVNASSHHRHCKPPYTTLYVYTFPVQKECVLLTHNHVPVNAQGEPFR
jgi:hypothetical protein